ncbi:MAG TPA: Ig-like domain-containing protein [Pyrinomonadaceae bacterium]|nr:Ig-like domain-containing protein [Pyrinomonadaceae bacterium]
MNYPIPFVARRNVRAFISAIISYLMLAGQAAPVALAANAAALRPAPQPVAAATVNFAPAPAAVLAAPIITATKVDAFPDPNSDGKADPGETITYTVTVSNTGSADATGVQFNDAIDPNTTFVPGSTTTQPITAPDTYNVIGNVDIHPDTVAGLLANDCDPDPAGGPCTNTGLTVTTLAGDNTAPFSGTSSQGGQVTSSTTDGAFTYNPPPGFAGTDTFTYTVTDGTGKTDTATVTLNVGNGTSTPGTNVIWFVNPSAPSGGDGRLTNPFNCYTGASASCFSQTAADDPGDTIFLFSGAHTGGNTLLNNQKLIGAGASDTLANLAGVTVPANSDTLPSTGVTSPTITTSAASTNGINLGQGNLLRGFTVGNTTGAKISGTSFGTLTVGNNTTPDVTLNGTGQALNLSTGTFAATSAFSSVTTTSSTAQGINLAGIAGTVAFGSTTVSGSTTQGILIGTTTAAINFGNTSVTGGTDGVSFQNNSSGTRTFGTLGVSGGSGNAFIHGAGGGNVTVNGVATLSSGNDPIEIANASNGTAINFAGGATVNKTTANGEAVHWSGTNTGATLTFATLALTTSNATGMNLSGGGTINVTTAAGSSITTVAGVGNPATAITANGVAFGMNFTTISHTGNGSTGLGINLTSITGSLTVNNGASTATNIQNTGGMGITISTSSATFNFGNTTVNGSANTGVNLATNTGAITFGQLNSSPDMGSRPLVATSNTGLITTTSGTLTSNQATAVTIAGASSASKTPLNMQLTAVNESNNGANGIFLQFTSASGSPGGFNVLGNGGTCTFASSGTCSGGTITATLGADNTTSGIGIYLENVDSASFTRMHINSNSNFAVRGINVNGFTFQTSVIDGNNGTSNTADAANGTSSLENGEDSIKFTNLTGSALIDSSTVSGGFLHNIQVVNNTGTLNRLTVSNSFVGDPDAIGSGQRGLAAASGDDFQFEAKHGVTAMNVTLSTNTFNFGIGRLVGIFNNDNANPVGSVDAVVRGNTMVNQNPLNSQAGGSHVLEISGLGNMTYEVSCNKLDNSLGINTIIFKGHNSSGTPSGNFTGTIFNNTIGIAGAGGVGSGGGGTGSSFATSAAGLDIDQQGSGTGTVLIKNNVIRHWTEEGIRLNNVDNLGTASTLNATVIGNVTAEPDTPSVGPPFACIFVVAGADPSTDASSITNLKLGGAGAEANNFFDGNANTTDIFLQTPFGHFNLTKGQGSCTGTGGCAASVALANNPTGPPTIFADTAIVVVNTTPTLPPAINETCTPPAAPGTIDGFGLGAPSGQPAGTVGEEQAAVGARSMSGAASGVTSRPFVAMPRQVQPAARPAASPQPNVASGKPSVATSTGRRITPAPNAPPCVNDSGHVCVQIGTLRAGDSVTITFQVTVNSPYNGGPNVSNQGIVSFNEGGPVLTDDTAVGGSADPTLTPINSVNVFAGDGKAPEPATGSAPLLFTVTLSTPSPGGVSVNYATADQAPGTGHAVGGATCDGTVDYQTTSGTVTFAAGERVKTVSVNVCADSTAGEPDETFLLNLSGAVGATIQDNQAVGTITASNPAGTFIISELRTSGPAGLGDDFVELYNNTDTPLTVTASDASAGFGVFKQGSDCNATPVLIATIPNGTVVPARGHYLLVGSQYSLGAYATGDQTLTADIESDKNVAVFTTSNVQNLSSAARLDAVGFDSNTGGGVCDLLREGNTLPPVSGSTTQYSFFRKECDFVAGQGCTVQGTPKDTNDNAADFKFADTQGTFISGVVQQLGAPGPENKTSPIRRDPSISVTLLDNSVSSAASPNRVRDLTSNPGNNSTFGTLSIRRRVTNNTGANVTRLRFRIVEMTTFPSPGGGQADLRAITSTDTTQSGVNDAGTCAPSSTPCTVTVRGTTLEQPPSQPNGGGDNSTLAVGVVTLAQPLAPNTAVNVQFLLGVQTTGTFRFLIITEALP